MYGYRSERKQGQPCPWLLRGQDFQDYHFPNLLSKITTAILFAEESQRSLLSTGFPAGSVDCLHRRWVFTSVVPETRDRPKWRYVSLRLSPQNNYLFELRFGVIPLRLRCLALCRSNVYTHFLGLEVSLVYPVLFPCGSPPKRRSFLGFRSRGSKHLRFWHSVDSGRMSRVTSGRSPPLLSLMGDGKAGGDSLPLCLSRAGRRTEGETLAGGGPFAAPTTGEEGPGGLRDVV
jgi:hypothetical protein